MSVSPFGSCPDAGGPVPVRLSTPADLAAAVPFLLGFEPNDSLVCVFLADGSVPLTARFDLPTAAHVPLLWPSVSPAATAAGADAVFLVLYAGADALPGVREWVLECVTAAPLPVLDVLRVDQGRYWSLTCTDPTCCPPGSPIRDRSDVADVLAPAVALAGRAVAPSRAALAESLASAGAEVLVPVAAVLAGLHRPPADPVAGYALLAAARRDRADGPRPVTAAQAPGLLHALADVDVRDACCGWTDDPAWWLWHDLIRLAPPSHTAPVATLIAVAAYHRGDGALAVTAAERALAADPGYELARLVLQLVPAGLDPTTFTAGLTVIAQEAAERLGVC